MKEKEAPESQEYKQYRRSNTVNKATVESSSCYKEHKLSMKCLDKNNFDREKCQAEFENFKLCKKFWHYVAFDRAEKGLPLKMTAEEKIQAKKDFAAEVDAKKDEYKRKMNEYNKFFKKPS